MSASINQRLRHTTGALALAVALLSPAVARALPLEGLPAAAAPAPTTSAVDPDLCAIAGNIDLPGAPATPIWGFALKPDAQTACSSLSPQLPGPVLEFATGDDVTLNVTNALPGGRRLSITIPGLSLDAGPTDAGPGDTVALHFTAGAPGTYLYSSVGDASDGGRQTAMGLYGALLVCSSTPCAAAGSDYGSPYDRARTLVLGEIDTHLNNDPDGFPMSQWNPGYWLINGKAHPDSPDIDANAGDRVLLRYLSAGPETVTMSMLGMHGHLVARDAYALSDPIDVIAETIPAGSTADMIVTVPTGTPSGTRLPLYNRQLRLNNGAYGDSQFAPADGGGMLTFVHVP